MGVLNTDKRNCDTFQEAVQKFARFFAEVTQEATRLQFELNADLMQFENIER